MVFPVSSPVDSRDFARFVGYFDSQHSFGFPYVSLRKSIAYFQNWVERDLEKLVEANDKLVINHAQGIYTDEEFYRVKDGLEEKIMVKKGLISEHKIDMLDVETAISFVVYYFSNLRRSWVDATLEGKLVLGVRMFPKGLTVEDGEFRTPELGRGYTLTREIASGSVKLGERF